jgi:hypothetical protein
MASSTHSGSTEANDIGLEAHLTPLYDEHCILVEESQRLYVIRQLLFDPDIEV